MPSALASLGVGSAAVAAAWSPPDAGGLVAWYKAESITGKVDGDPVAQWDDSSGNARHLTQVTAGKQPLYKTGILNGLPSVRFDGVDDVMAHLAGAAYATGTTLTLAVVHIRRAQKVGSRLFACHDSTQAQDFNSASEFIFYTGGGGVDETTYRNGVTTTHALSLNGPALSLVWFDGTNANQRFNKAAASTPSAASTGSFSIDHLVLGTGWQGGAPSGFSQDDIGEWIVWNGDIGSTHRTNLETYAAKWGF